MTRSPRTAALCAALCAAAAFSPAPAFAWCRTHGCDASDPAFSCARDPASGCPVNQLPLYWPSSCLSFGVQEDASPLREIDYATAHSIVATAFDAWQSADCGGGSTPSFTLRDYGQIECNQLEYSQTDGNANVVMFRDEGWPHDDSEDALALTTITFNTETGEIYDADVEVNSAEALLTVGDTGVVSDLPSIITHEVGHFLGLSHSTDPDATMQPNYDSGDLELRTLEADDVTGICTLYAPDRELPPASCEPRHGFSSQCEGAAEEGCSCSVPGAPTRPGGFASLSLLGAALLGLRFRRRR